ncbi:hypothetical protein TNCV_1580471 [Trichonephila clavipes]|nr:hypothetical protein TNCV_1580471 [Trichonephila clavipes]
MLLSKNLYVRKGSIDRGFYMDDVRVRVPEDDIISEKPHLTPSRDDFLNARNVYERARGSRLSLAGHLG